MPKVLTAARVRVPPTNEADYLATLPVRRLSTPAEIGFAVAFLASDEASFFTGQVLSPNAGTVI